MIVLPEKEIAGLVTATDCFTAVEKAFGSMAKRAASNFSVVREGIGHSDAIFGVKSGIDRNGPVLGLKSGGFWPHNDGKGLTNHQSTIMLFDANTGRCRALVGGNLLTALRTAAASAISIQHLSRPDSKVLGMIGAGHQSTFQLRAALQQRAFERVIGWNITPEALGRLEWIANEHDLPFESVDLDTLGKMADVIVTITSSFAPILHAAQVRPGTHLACMGTDTRGKQEVEAQLVANATVFTDEIEQAVTIGETQHAFNAGIISAEDLVPIGDVINQDHPGRIRPDEITLFDGTGVAVQDLAVATAAVDLAVKRGLAIELDF